MLSYRRRYQAGPAKQSAPPSRINLFGIMLANRRRTLTADMFVTHLALAFTTVDWLAHFNFDP